MTPEKAKRLLDKVKENCPLPWEIGIDRSMAGDEYQVIVYNGNETYNDNLAYAVGYDGEVTIDPDAIGLVAAAPELAETIAGLRYEYAAQVRRGSASPWLYVRQNGHFSKRGSTSVWCKRRTGCENAIRGALKRKDVGADTVEFRVVRRLVGDPEVVE